MGAADKDWQSAEEETLGLGEMWRGGGGIHTASVSPHWKDHWGVGQKSDCLSARPMSPSADGAGGATGFPPGRASHANGIAQRNGIKP